MRVSGPVACTSDGCGWPSTSAELGAEVIATAAHASHTASDRAQLEVVPDLMVRSLPAAGDVDTRAELGAAGTRTGREPMDASRRARSEAALAGVTDCNGSD